MHIIRFKAGFANQLFQYCFYLQRCEIYGEDSVVADLSFINEYQIHGGYKLRGKANLNYLSSLEGLNCIRVSEENIDKTEFVETADYLYDGYWQDTKYFPHDLSPVLAIIEQDSQNPKVNRWLDTIKSGVSVSIHIRRGDYVNHPVHGNIANRCYYQNAIDYMILQKGDATFFVFSDDIQWARDNLNFGTQKVYYVSDFSNQEWNDIYLMSMCNHHILSNSSFSWWSHYFNRSENTICVFPEYWYNVKYEAKELDLFGHVVRMPNTPVYKSDVQHPEFSILIPAYNKQYEIKRCLATVLNQSFQNIEVLIVDDGSSDDTSKVVEEYANRDSRVRLIQNSKNESLLYSRFVGMKHARGSYALMVDADDYIELDMCQILYNHVQDQNIDILEFQYINEPSKKLGPWPNTLPNDIPKAIMSDYYSHSVWKRCYSSRVVRKLVEKADAFYCNMSEDGFFTVALSILAEGYKRIPNVLYHYVQQSGMSNTGFLSKEQVLRAVDSIQQKRDRLSIFLTNERSDLKEYEEVYYQNDLKKVVQLCTGDKIPIEQQLELLRCIDEQSGTRFAIQHDAFIKEAIQKEKLYQGANIRKKSKILLKQFKNDVLLKAVNKVIH